MPAVSYSLSIDGQSASADLLASLLRVEFEDHAEMADMLRLEIATSVREDGSGWTLLDEEQFPRLANIRLGVTVGSGESEPLGSTHVIETNAEFSNEPGRSVLHVVAMDPTVLLNLEERVRAWPNMADSDVARQIFQDAGFTPQVDETQPTRQDDDVTTMQRGTDMQFLKQLAQRNNFECYVELNSSTGEIEGHFHLPRVDTKPQGVLAVNMGEATNVNSFRARVDMLKPTTARAAGIDIESQDDQSADQQSLALTALGSTAALSGDRPRKVLLSRGGLFQTGELQNWTQAVVDRSAWAITAEGDLHTQAYGAILRAKRPVNVRGAGRQFSGTYYVERVLHSFTAEGYTQNFTLRRNALGVTGRETFVEDSALE